MAHCEGPIHVQNARLRWLCQGKQTTMMVDVYKKLLAFKPWCVEGEIVRGVNVDPVGAGCFRSKSEAEAYAKSLQAGTAPTLSGVGRCKCRRRRSHR